MLPARRCVDRYCLVITLHYLCCRDSSAKCEHSDGSTSHWLIDKCFISISKSMVEVISFHKRLIILRLLILGCLAILVAECYRFLNSGSAFNCSFCLITRRLLSVISLASIDTALLKSAIAPTKS